MKKYITLILICLSLAITLFAKPIPFDPISGIVLIDVVLNGSIKAKFGIDTGADRFYLDRKFAVDNGIEILQAPLQQKIQGVDGAVNPFSASISLLDISDNIKLQNISATVVDFDKLSNGVEPPNGVIGYSILKNYYVNVDYPNKTIELEKETPRFLSGRKFKEIPFSSYQHLIIVQVVLNDNLTVPMLVDYCASFTTITPELAKKLEIPIRDDRKAVLQKVDIDGVQATDVWAYLSDLKEFKQANPRATFDGIIGSSFLYNFNVTIDYTNKKIYIRD